MDSYRSRILSRTDREPPPVSALLAPGGVPRLRGDHDLNPPDTDVWVEPHERPALRAAAVLVPVVEHAHGAHVLLTRRADHLGTHSGQVAFPGGKIDPGETPAEAALREAEEEVGLARAHVDVAGYLDAYETGTGFRILPVVAFVTPGFSLTISPHEVAEAFEVPFDFLMDPANHKRHSAVWRGKRREYYAMPYNGHYIWGATAGMLKNMYDRLYGA
ncbi:CoA pyrophosphatase [uncultured Parvibaculum sp.]|uniref:NUDIX hydrolase n=1 Tax=uncultured Parvibaculum sp. TaxID=291828 RepID=UPI0030DCC47C|tara:strand:- start:11686 stop:12336 length:651 start_codon:yes stop_codon:yes gene_type:complete